MEKGRKREKGKKRKEERKKGKKERKGIRAKEIKSQVLNNRICDIQEAGPCVRRFRAHMATTDSVWVSFFQNFCHFLEICYHKPKTSF